MAKMIAKLSMKTLGTNPSECKSEKRETPVARIWGVASGLVQKPGKDGDITTGLTGTFKALALNGDFKDEEFSSGVCYLPSGISEMVEAAVFEGDIDEKGKPIYNSVKFALDISAVPAFNPIGYSYQANPLIDAEENDPLADIAKEMPALPKPGKKMENAPAPEEIETEKA